jgi:hypothetical protein
MDVQVTSKNGFNVTVYECGSEIRYCLTEKFNPMILNARDPVFKGSMRECVEYIRRN